jgi:hypothetical protein|tara:strand:- start:1262 stop:1501 length:240 start_codon:yes stop_codon:yes gene_type:complete
MKRGDLVMYDHNLAVTAIVIDMKPDTPAHSWLNLLQVSGHEWFIIPFGFDSMYRSCDFIVCEKDRKAQMADLLSRQIDY